MYKFNNLNQALIGMSKELLEKGVKRKTRGFDCYELPTPVLICIENPSDRYINIPERKWNKMLPFAESLWLSLGLNDLDELPGNYVKNLYNFSDDGRTWRAGYAPRFRFYSGFMNDYDISNRKHGHIISGRTGVIDQFKYIVESFERDINTRQAVISIADPAKDCFDTDGKLKITKDYPCTRSLHFQVNTDGELDMIVDMRSNDVLWGFSAINLFNFMLIQEYFANIIGVPVGRYYHKADNFHFYDNFRSKLELFAQYDITAYPEQEKFFYKSKIQSLNSFDKLTETLFDYEKSLRIKGQDYIVDFGNDMFNDWAKVFYHHWTKKEVEFENPYLNKLFYD